MEIRVLTPDLRRELRAPLGLLIRGSFGRTMERLRELAQERNPKKLIAVGDRVSRNMIREGMPLSVVIVDNRVMRKPIAPIGFEAEETYRVRNPAGTLTDEALQGVREAIEHGGKVIVLVEGEEDLLTLAAVLSAPENSLVVYGQPREGIVVIEVNEGTKTRFREILERMELSKD